MTESEQLSKNLIILAEKVLSCTPDEKTEEMIYRVKWFDNLIPESKMKVMFPDLLNTFKEENNNNINADCNDGKVVEETKEIGKNTRKCKERCQHCDEVFTKSYLLEEHNDKYHPETLKYPCKFCQKKFQTDSELNWHMLAHQTVCSENKNRFILPKPTKDTNQSDGIYSCKCCNQYFSTKEARDIHVKRNRSKRKGNKTVKSLEKVQCDLCDKVVTRKRLESHKMVYHFKNGRFPCEQCDKRFLNERDLQRHLTVHNEEVIQAKKYKVECDICGKSLTKVRLENHKLRFHFTEGEYTCKNCEKTFPHLVDLDWHLSNECTNR